MSIEFHSDRAIKAVRKARRCDECGHMIEVGQAARAYAQKFAGEMYHGTVHPDCQAWANKVIQTYDPFGEGRPFLRDADPTEEDWNVEWLTANPTPPDLYARLPKAWQECVDYAAGLNTTPTQSQERRAGE